jgi:pyruvate/2-oxoglutarate dehydrogenase complex dihydrolipoamide dehydrogenase (E3) component
MGRARIVDPWTVEIARHDGGVQRLTTRSIVIAAGAAPLVPALPGLEQSGYLTSETLWDALAEMDSVPGRVLVLGGGPIGCELAQALARLGAGVTLVEKADRVLAREDEEVSALAAGALAGAGVKVLTGHEALRCEGRQLVVTAGGGEVTLAHDVLIVALGRAARLSGYGLEELGIETDGTLVTDDWLATLYPNIHAAGDVAGPYQFTHVAAHQAWYASVNALFGDLWRFRADYRVIPRVTFLDPEVARVGLNEAEAQAAGIAYEVTRYGVDDLDRAIADSAAEGFVKVLTVPGKDRILGVTIVAAGAGEMLAEYVLAMKHGLGLNKVLGTIHAYPTMVEANKYAAGEWKRAHKPETLLRLVKRYHDWRRG